MNLRESEVQQIIRLEASRKGHRLFRSNSGLYYTKDRRPVKIGLAEFDRDWETNDDRYYK